MKVTVLLLDYLMNRDLIYYLWNEAWHFSPCEVWINISWSICWYFLSDFFFLYWGLNSGPCTCLYYLSHTSSPFCFRLFFRWDLVLFASVILQPCSPTYVSHIAGIIGLYYHAHLVCFSGGGCLTNFLPGLTSNLSYTNFPCPPPK
jgi:hypothetical protein